MQSERTSRVMRRVHSVGTEPELLLRRALWKRGLRYVKNCASLPGKPDIVFTKAQVAVFVDGELWHGHQWEMRNLNSLEGQFVKSKSADYWVPKIRKTMYRDIDITHRLQEMGWRVIRLWAHDVVVSCEGCADLVERAVWQGDAGSKRDTLLSARTVAEFFAGIGLVRIGLQASKWRVLFANDFDPLKVRMYSDQFSDTEQVMSMTDVHVLSASDVPPVTIATASFPCNDLSAAGGRLGLDGSKSSAFWGFARVLEAMSLRPPILLVENVMGLLTTHGGSSLERVLSELNHLGYCVDVFEVDARHFVPQSRRRLFVVAAAEEVRARSGARLDVDEMSPSDTRPAPVVQFMLRHPDLRWGIRRLPNLPHSEMSIASIVARTPPEECHWWSAPRVARLISQMRPTHRGRVLDLMKRDQISFATVFRRTRQGHSAAEVRSDGVAGCLRTPRGGSAREILLELGHGCCRVRLLAPRECAALMGAEDYEISVSDNQALFGFGDAVCVPVISWIAQNYLDPLIADSIRGTILGGGI